MQARALALEVACERLQRCQAVDLLAQYRPPSRPSLRALDCGSPGLPRPANVHAENGLGRRLETFSSKGTCSTAACGARACDHVYDMVKSGWNSTASRYCPY